VASFHQLEHETFLRQKLKLLTIEICWQNLLPRKICWQNLLTKIESADDQKTVPAQRITTCSKNFASRQPGHGWRAHSFGQIWRLYMCLGRTFLVPAAGCCTSVYCIVVYQWKYYLYVYMRLWKNRTASQCSCFTELQYMLGYRLMEAADA
jgi:hypothetical protein